MPERNAGLRVQEGITPYPASHAVKKIASKEPSGKAGVQPVCGGQARRGEWPIMIHLEISQHAVVEVRYL